MENIVFIINPISERFKRVDVRQLIIANLDHSKFSYTIKYSDYPGHAYEMALAMKKDFRTIVAAGGDGTVNQVSRALVGSANYLGLIPLGSGNGLARALKIPMNIAKAVKIINRQRVIRIDTGVINDTHFINMAGIGFDAEIAHEFAQSDQRGFISYFTRVLKKIHTYTPGSYTFGQDDAEHHAEAFLISFANSSQYGNNAHISPRARLDDGLLDVCLMKKFPLWRSPLLASRLFLKNIDRSGYMNILQTDRLTLNSTDRNIGHVDGEPVIFEKEVRVRIVKNSLHIIV